VDARQLIGLQRAEFAMASRLDSLAVSIPILIMALSGAAVFLLEPLWTYAAAVAVLILTVLWAFLDWRFRRSRLQAERARRATLLMEGLGEDISSSELMNLSACFTVGAAKGKKLEDATYFSTGAAAGDKRLADNLEQSAFFSYYILRDCGTIAWLFFGLIFLIALLLFFVSIPSIQASQVQGAVRVLCAVLTLLTSAQVLGRALSYSIASRELGNLLPRLDAVRASGFPRPDLLLLLCDYNSVVEAAPMFLPWIYSLKRENLDRIWNDSRGAATDNDPSRRPVVRDLGG